MHNKASIFVYSFIISVALHLVLFVPWTTPQKVEKKQETIPVSFRTIAKKETQPPAPKKAKENPKRAKGLPQTSPPAVKPPPPPPPKPPPEPRASEQPVAVAQTSAPPPPPPPKPEPKVEPVKPTPKAPPPPVAKKLAPAKDAKKPPEQKVVKKEATKPEPKKAQVKKKPPKPKKTVKKKVAKKRPESTTQTTPQEKELAAKTRLPTLRELLPPLSGSGRMASGSHGNEYISMDSRDPQYSSWLASLQRDIYRTWLPSYPKANIRGEVLLGLMISKNGDLEHVEILHSSGLGLLDRHAMEAVRAASPFTRFPPWMTQDQQGIKATFTYGGSPGSISNWGR